MDRTQLEQIERLLVREREKILRSLGRFQQQSKLSRESADADLSSYSFHMADQGTDAMEREKAFLFASKEGRQLYQIDDALRRLYRQPDGFGRCVQCNDPIHWERLEALPYATLCIGCKEREENGRGV